MSNDATSADPAAHLAEARRLLALGQVTQAQLRLERLVAAYPASPEALSARRELARIYAALDPANPSAANAGGSEGAAQGPAGRGRSSAVESSPLAPLADPPADQPAPGLPLATSPARSSDMLAATDTNASFRLGSVAGDRVFFAGGSADLGARARLVIARQAQFLSGQVAAPILIVGHADDPGSEEENTVLAARRAEAVRLRLIEEGIPPHRIRTLALGHQQRVAPCEGPACAAQNRRVVTLVLRAEARVGEPAGRGNGAVR
ncbi:MAG: OmpA family protein [Hyphomicrobiaceae bacterium]|nr:OmpA family protein [Hyphomicrobiaceae bacterium]